MIGRRMLLVGLALEGLRAARPVAARAARGVRRIGWLSPASAAEGGPNIEALREGLGVLEAIAGEI